MIVRYFDWLGGLLTGNLGTSIANGLPVGELVGDRIVNSAVLVLASAIVMIPLAFGIAMISANYRGKRTDGVIQVVMITLAGLPEFVVGILLVALFSTTVFHVLPAVTIAGGGAPPWSNPASMILPVLTLVIAVTPYVSRIVRSSLLEVLDSDYVELARLKGVPERVVMRKHALLNAIVPGIQVIALQLAWLAGGVVFVEYLFSYPGIGRQPRRLGAQQRLPDGAGAGHGDRRGLRGRQPDRRHPVHPVHPASEDGDLVMSVIESGQPAPHRQAAQAGHRPGDHPAHRARGHLRPAVRALRRERDRRQAVHDGGLLARHRLPRPGRLEPRALRRRRRS